MISCELLVSVTTELILRSAQNVAEVYFELTYKVRRIDPGRNKGGGTSDRKYRVERTSIKWLV